MVIHSLLLRSLHPHPGKGRDDQAIGLPPLLGRVGLMVMVIHMCLLRIISFSKEGKGWWPWSYISVFLEYHILF